MHMLPVSAFHGCLPVRDIPRPNLDASTCKITGLEVLRYIRHASLLMLSFSFWKLASWLSVH